MNDEEILDLVSLDDVVIGTMSRSKIYAQQLHCFRVVCAFIFNDKGQLWIPRRHPNKKLFPLHLDGSVGGHVCSGETYDQAFVRETMEELNIDVVQCSHKFLFYLTPHEHGTSAFMRVYGLYQNSVPDYNKEDFVGGYWIFPEDLLACIKAGEKAKPDLPIIVQYMQHNKFQ